MEAPDSEGIIVGIPSLAVPQLGSNCGMGLPGDLAWKSQRWKALRRTRTMLSFPEHKSGVLEGVKQVCVSRVTTWNDGSQAGGVRSMFCSYNSEMLLQLCWIEIGMPNLGITNREPRVKCQVEFCLIATSYICIQTLYQPLGAQQCICTLPPSNSKPCPYVCFWGLG